MSNYRVKVEVLNPELDASEELLDGFECEGFAMILDEGTGSTIAVQHMTSLDIAKGIASSPTIRAAAHLGNALREAKKIEDEGKAKSMFEKIMQGMKDD